MSFDIITPARRRGAKRNPVLYMLALEYLLWPGKRPNGLQKELAHSNGICPGVLNTTISVITRATTRARARKQ